MDRGGDGSLLLEWEQIPTDGPAWLEGEIVVRTDTTLSGLYIAALYDAYGAQVEHPRMTVRSEVGLRFRIDLAALPHAPTQRVRTSLSHSLGSIDNLVTGFH